MKYYTRKFETGNEKLCIDLSEKDIDFILTNMSQGESLLDSIKSLVGNHIEINDLNKVDIYVEESYLKI